MGTSSWGYRQLYLVGTISLPRKPGRHSLGVPCGQEEKLEIQQGLPRSPLSKEKQARAGRWGGAWMPIICNPQHFLLLMNYLYPWPGGRSIMQEADGPGFQLNNSTPGIRKGLSTALLQRGSVARICAQASQIQLSLAPGWNKAKNTPRKGTFL